ncbi:MAG: DUF1573 domain-containing protein [Pseudomonadota bacterium]
MRKLKSLPTMSQEAIWPEEGIAVVKYVNLVLAFLIALFISDTCFADGPRIKFRKLSHDYGKVFSGQTVSAEFEFYNAGDGVLRIEGLTSSCGCTKAIEGSKEISPSGASKIVAEFDTIGLKAGRKQKTVFVKSNDSVNPVVKLTLFADVVKDLNVSPVSLNKKVSSVDQPVVFPLDITNSSKKSYKIIEASTMEGDAQVELDPSSLILEPSKPSHLNLLLKLKPDSNRSFYAGRIRLKTDHPHESEIEIPFLIKLEN